MLSVCPNPTIVGSEGLSHLLAKKHKQILFVTVTGLVMPPTAWVKKSKQKFAKRK